MISQEECIIPIVALDLRPQRLSLVYAIIVMHTYLSNED